MPEAPDLENLAGWASYLMDCRVTSAQLRRLHLSGALAELSTESVEAWSERPAALAAKGDPERIESLIAAAETKGKAALAKYPPSIVVLLDGKEGDERVAAVLRLRHVEPYYSVQVNERDKEFSKALRAILDRRIEETRGRGLPFADNDWLNKEFPWIVNREYPTLRSTMPLPELNDETRDIPSAVDYKAIEVCERLPESFPAHGSNGGNDQDGGLGMKPPEYVALLISDNGRSGAKVVARVVLSNIKRIAEIEGGDEALKDHVERLSKRRNLKRLNSHDIDPFDPEWMTGDFIADLRAEFPGLVITDPLKRDSEFADRYFAAELDEKTPDWMRGFRVYGEVQQGPELGRPQLES